MRFKSTKASSYAWHTAVLGAAFSPMAWRGQHLLSVHIPSSQLGNTPVLPDRRGQSQGRRPPFHIQEGEVIQSAKAPGGEADTWRRRNTLAIKNDQLGDGVEI